MLPIKRQAFGLHETLLNTHTGLVKLPEQNTHMYREAKATQNFEDHAKFDN